MLIKLPCRISRVLWSLFIFLLFLSSSYGIRKNTIKDTSAEILQAETPWQTALASPEEPFAVSVTATGPYRAPANVELVASVTHPSNTTISKIEFYNNNTLLGTVIDPPYEFAYQNIPQGTYRIEARAYDTEGNTTSAMTEWEVVPSNRYNRGFGTNQNYISSIIALDFERGIFLDGISDFRTIFPTESYPWFLRATSSAKNPCNHIKYDPNVTVDNISYVAVNNLPTIDGNPVGGQPPMVAFGSQGGGTPLRINQNYSFGIVCGGQDVGSLQGCYFQIEVYDKNDFANSASNVAPVCCQFYLLPKSNILAAWSDFCNNAYVKDYHLNTNVNGNVIDFDTQIQYVPTPGLNNSWGQPLSFPLVVTHRASNANYYYKVSFRGVTAAMQNNTLVAIPMAKNAAQTAQSYNISYTLDFDTPPSWGATLIEPPHFQTISLPSSYSGKSVDELVHQAPIVSDHLAPPDEKQTAQFTQLNNSPELKTHPILDQLVNDLGNDPYAIANYVQNEIELTDAMGFNATDTADPASINPQGMMRDALATYLEGQGSPIEQCALLVYLLRRIGVPAAYVFPEHNGTLMFDEQMSKLLHTQLRGTVNYLREAPIPELIPVNYPWVVAFVEGKWVHLFPWLKDTEVTEGKNLWSYFPQGYATGGEWLLHYLLDDPNIRSLSNEDNIGVLFPLYAKNQLSGNDLTLDDVGMHYVNRPHYYSEWNDFPRPWQTPIISIDNIAPNLNASSSDQNPKLVPTLNNLFDTIEIQVLRDSNGNGQPDLDQPILKTGPMRFVDLHDRRLLLYHQIAQQDTPPTYNVILSLEAYDSTEGSQDTNTYAFTNDPGDLRSSQKTNALLQVSSTLGDLHNDKRLFYKISCKHHIAARDVISNENEQGYFNQWPGLVEEASVEDIRPLNKGDMAVLSLNYGRVTEKMKDLELQKYLDYQKRVQIDPSIAIDPEIATGQILQLMGKSYYYRISQFQDQIEALTKTHVLSWRAHGLTKLSPERDTYGEPITNRDNGSLDFNLLYPRVDMSYSRAASMANANVHAESGNMGLPGEQAIELIVGELSAQEHHIINDFFNQTNAVSTVKLLDLAQQGKEGIALLTAANCQEEGDKLYTATTVHETQSAPHKLSEWLGSKSIGLWPSITALLSQPTYPNPVCNAFGFLCNMSIVTRAPVTATGQQGTPYTGMGAFNLALGTTGDCTALISDGVTIENGGYGGAITPISSSHPKAVNADFDHYLQEIKGDQDWDPIKELLHPFTLSQPTQPNQTPPSQDQVAILKREVANHGYIGIPSYYGKLLALNFVHDPVSVVTGEFYVNTLDLELKGPMPLELRRTYSSQNLAENNLGAGWKLGLFHYLMLSADGNETTPATLIYAAEPDGSVLAYRYHQAENTWVPEPGDNPNLINANDGSLQPSHNLLPSSRNLFNNRITKTTSNDLTTYLLSGSDGSTRTFTVRSFPLINDPTITRTRPYLDTWQDAKGNSLNFAYGTNNKASNWGELTAITSSNGNTLHFSYDARGHITEAFGSDGCHLIYHYDNFGDLIKVTLPDKSAISYQYAHTNSSGKTTSTHLLTQETKPGDRLLKNDYDEQRRVRTQYASGTSPQATLSATFDYNLTNTKGVISGNMTVSDATGNRTDYLVSDNQITNIIYPADAQGTRAGIVRQWTNNGTCKSLASKTDLYNLTTTYAYDGVGNLTSKSETGNLTGSGGNENATTRFTYNGNNLLTSITDAVGNTTSFTYSGPNVTSIASSKLGSIRSSQLTYTNQGGAHGLLNSMNQSGTVTTFTYNSKGFLTSKTQPTGTKDPALTENISCDGRGNIIQTINNLGEKKTYRYDMMDRLIFEETFDVTGAPIDWHSWYYNGNGEITWEQGARFNPVDYVTYAYDWAGRVIHKGTWQSKALPDGSGVTGAGIVAENFTYDLQGNRISMTDPNGNVTSMTYDANGNMLTRTKGNTSETFSYTAAGEIATHTTVLGGTEQKSYTSRGQIASSTAANGATTSYRYDLIGRLTQTIFFNGTQETIAYDDTNNKRTITLYDKNGNSLSNRAETFDAQGNKTSWTDEAGNLFEASYDNLDRIVSLQGPPGESSSAIQQKEYHYGINSITAVNSLGEWTTTYIDALKRPLSTFVFNRDGSLAYKESKWYSGDHQSVTTWQGSNATSITTDLQGHPLIVKHADGSYKVMTYDANGNQTGLKDEEGNVTSFTYDGFNHLTSKVLPDSSKIGYSYNPLGELLCYSLPGSITQQNNYNEAGEKISEELIGSDGNVTRHYTYGYSQGMLSSIGDPRGFTTSIEYDGLGRAINVTSPNQKTTYGYDPRGLLTLVAQQSNGSSTQVSRAYDAYSQLISENTSINGTAHSAWKQSWDGAGRRIALNWIVDKQSPAAQYAFSYNALGEMTSAQNGSGACSYGYGTDGLLLSRRTPFGTTTITRDNRSRITSEQLPTGALESMSWRGDDRLASYSMADPSGALISETRNYAYDARGRVTQEPFTSKEAGTQLASYEFDPLNVRMRQEVDGAVAAAVVGENGFAQVTRDNFPTDQDHVVESSYDGAGNVSVYGNKTLTWDSFGRLVNVSQRDENNRGYEWTTIYDGLGRRLQTSYSDATGNQTTSAPLTLNYYYDPEVEFLEIGHDYFGRTWNLYGPDRSGLYGGAQGVGGMETTYEEHGQVTYGILKNFFGDHLGNLNTLGLYAWDAVIGGYGAMPGFSVNTDLVPQWRGHYLDWTGLYCLGTRYYDPASGRFLSADPLGHATSLSLYDYCDGDPVNGLDPDGRCVEKAHEEGFLNETEYQNATFAIQMMRDNPTLNLKKLLMTVGGIELAYVDSDLNDPTFLEARNQALERVPNEEQVMSVNGIFTRADQAQENANTIAVSMHLQKDDVLRINNYTHRWRDLMRASFEQLGFIDIRSLCLADIVNFNNGGKITAFSNASIVVANAAAYMTATARANVKYTGLNPQRYIGKEEFGFKSTINARNEYDVVSLLFPSNRFQQWDKTLKTDGCFFDLLGNHSFKKNYPTLIEALQKR